MEYLPSPDGADLTWSWGVGDGCRRDWPDEVEWLKQTDEEKVLQPTIEGFCGAPVPRRMRKTIWDQPPRGGRAIDEPLQDFYVSMPNLMSIEPDLSLLPQQVKTALSFLRVVCPRDIVTDETAAKLNSVLPPQRPEHRGKRTLLLDLDETLVHCHPSPVPGAPPPALHTRIEAGAMILDAHVYVRPFTQLALEVFSHLFEVVIFTASASVYADRVLDFLDPDGRRIHYRLYRQHCTEIYGGHFKDLRRLGRRLDDCILVDNSPLALGLIPDNGIPVSSWFGDDLEDSELLDLIRLLEMCTDSQCPSVSQFLIERFGFNHFLHYLRTTADVPGLQSLQGMQTGQSSGGLTTQVQR